MSPGECPQSDRFEDPVKLVILLIRPIHLTFGKFFILKYLGSGYVSR